MKRLIWALAAACLTLVVAAPALAGHGHPTPPAHPQHPQHPQQTSKVTLCHHPLGHPATNGVTIRVSERAAQAHLRHHKYDHLGACTAQERQKAPKPLGTLELKKVVIGPSGSTDTFAFTVDGQPFGTGNLANGGTTGAHQVDDAQLTVAEIAGNATTSLGRYTTAYSCAGATPSGTGSGQSFTLTVARGAAVVCTVTNTHVAEASGQYSYNVGDNVTRSVTLDAYVSSAGQAQGSLSYSDSNGDAFTANVQCLLISGSTAYFSGQVTAGSGAFSGDVGQYLLQKVVDGSPDTTAGAFYATSQCATLGTVQPSADFPISSGDITVYHS